MHCIFSPAANGEAGISTAAPSHPQAATITAAASAKPMAHRRISSSRIPIPASPRLRLTPGRSGAKLQVAAFAGLRPGVVEGLVGGRPTAIVQCGNRTLTAYGVLRRHASPPTRLFLRAPYWRHAVVLL